MSERFIKFIPSEEAMYLILHKPNAFRLLTIIATRARREPGLPDGLKPGECFLGDWKDTGFTEQEYRTAKIILELRQHLKIVETCRTRKKSTTGATTIGTKVMLISTSVYDINLNIVNDRINDRATTEQRPSNDNQERNKKVKNELKSQQQHSKIADAAGFDDEIYDCLKISELEFADRITLMKLKVSERRMKQGVAFAQKKRGQGQLKASFGACVNWYVRQDEFFPDLTEQKLLAEKYLRELESMRMETAVKLNENFSETETLFVLLKGKETRISLKDPYGLVESQINECLRELKEKFKDKIVSLKTENDLNDLQDQKANGVLS